ncbi:MAG TPA: autotransporter-associated beta strand repeat-containing protein [Rariglobus sp.]|nr:autotransporter-associated beta strand repeat-containing protein [Rariglobus sp.]
MKKPRFASFTLPALAATLAAVFPAAHTAHATDIVKADNTTALNVAGSYTTGGPPGAGDRIQVSSVLTANRTSLLGGDLSIAGIFIDSTATKVLQINGSNTLTLGSSGITIASTLSGAGLTFNGPAISLGANQTWDLGIKGLTISGGTTLANNGNTLAISTTGGQIFFSNTTPMTMDATIGGSVALTLSSTASELTLVNANSTFTGGIAISAGNTVTGSTMSTLAGSGSSSVGNGQVQLKGGTFKYSGNTATSAQNVAVDSRFIGTLEVTTAGQTLTLSNFRNTNTSNPSLTANGANLGGAGNLTITNVVADSTQALKTSFSVTKFGTGTLTLTAVNTYTGDTTINAGTLALNTAGSINANSAITVAAGATFDTSARTGGYAFNTTKTTTIGVSSTAAGLINSAAVTFSSASLGFDFGATTTLLSSYTILTKTGFTGDFANVTATGTSISGTFVNAGSGNWTLTAGGYDLTFSESLGTLTAVSSVPEPSTYAVIFGSVALVGASIRRRRANKIA